MRENGRVHLFAAKAGEVLLVDGDGGGAVAARSVATASTARATVSAAGTTATTTATAAGSAATSAGSLDETHVDIKVVLFLALLGGALVALVILALDVGLLFVAALDFLSTSPLLVGLGALVGSTDGLGGQVFAGSLFSEVVGERLGLVNGLFLLGGGLGLVLIGLGDVISGPLIVPGLFTVLVTPALVHLLAGITITRLVSYMYKNRNQLWSHKQNSRLTGAGLAVATGTTSTTVALVARFLDGLIAVVAPTSVAVTESYK